MANNVLFILFILFIVIAHTVVLFPFRLCPGLCYHRRHCQLDRFLRGLSPIVCRGIPYEIIKHSLEMFFFSTNVVAIQFRTYQLWTINFCTATRASYRTFGSSWLNSCITNCLPPRCSITLKKTHTTKITSKYSPFPMQWAFKFNFHSLFASWIMTNIFADIIAGHSQHQWILWHFQKVNQCTQQIVVLFVQTQSILTPKFGRFVYGRPFQSIIWIMQRCEILSICCCCWIFDISR